jgi:5'-deoxynucleotidase YfbR-like HD superfamily hydrolase
MKAKDVIVKLLADEAFVLAEMRRLQWLFGLKHEIRYGQKRVNCGGDSVAEHLYGMQVAFHYFWPLEDQGREWNSEKMLSMITWHDVDEIVVGDTIGYDKTDEHRQAEEQAMEEVYKNLPCHLTASVKALIEEYNAKTTAEARFVKAIDKIEPLIHLFTPEGKDLLQRMGTTFEQNASIKLPFFQDFPVIKRFYEVCSTKMREEGYFAG